jgi:uncharacterized protein (TIGR02266 family)
MTLSTKSDILVVDHDEKTRNELMLIAGACGYSAKGFSNAGSALLHLSKNLPRLVICELLLPDKDGFELCQDIRTKLNYPTLPILCTTAISWGAIDLPALLQRRFQAKFISKGTLANNFIITLHDILGGSEQTTDLDIGLTTKSDQAETRPTTSKTTLVASKHMDDGQNLVDEDLANLCLGLEEVLRTQDLTDEFEQEVANVETSSSRCSVRVQAEYEVQFRNLNDLVKEFTNNISIGGLFIYTDVFPEPNEVIKLRLQLPSHDEPIQVQGRVVHIIDQEQAEKENRHAGFGVQFLDLSAEGRLAINRLLDEVQAARSSATPTGEPDITWIVLIGLPMLPIVGRPNFLLRENIRVVEFPDMSIAEEFLSQQSVDLIIIGKTIIEQDETTGSLEKLSSLVDQKTKKMVMLDHLHQLPISLTHEHCHVVVEKDLTLEDLLDELSRRLKISKRKNLRVPQRGKVSVQTSDTEFVANLVNISCGGMMLCSQFDLDAGQKVRLSFELPGTAELTCIADIIRKRQEPDGQGYSYGVMFTEFFTIAEDEIRNFVQKHINFREFFRWMKKKYFEWP